MTAQQYAQFVTTVSALMAYNDDHAADFAAWADELAA